MGMGPVCSERLRFAEDASQSELESMRNKPEPASSRVLLPHRNLILEKKEDNFDDEKYILGSILGVQSGGAIFIDRQKLKDNYGSSKNYSEALAQSLNLITVVEISTISSIAPPNDPKIRRKYNKFQRNYREKIKDREEKMISDKVYDLDYSFGNIETTRHLSKSQEQNRQEMLNLKETDPDKFNQLYGTAQYHLATFVFRLEGSNFKELLSMRQNLLKRNKIEIDVKDYGLVTKEIVSGLQISNKNLERHLFKSFVEGNVNIPAINQILENQEQLEPKDKLLSFKIIQTLTNDPYMKKGHENPDSYEQIRNFIKKYNLNVFNSWKT